MRKHILGFSICLLLFLSIISFIIFGVDQESREREKKVKVTHQYEKIEKVDSENSIVAIYQDEFNNSDIIGKLYIPNTSLNVPIVQGEDNEYYLNHLIDKSYNTLGSVFLDYRNQVTDQKILIYGHNSWDVSTEFHMLENYLDSNYYDGHSEIYFETDDQVYHYRIFSVYIATNDFQHVNLKLSDSEYATHLYWLSSQSIYDTGVSVSNYDDILILQTCYFEPKDSFIIVAAKKI